MLTAGAAAIVARRAERAAATQLRTEAAPAPARATLVLRPAAASARAGGAGGLVVGAAEHATCLVSKKAWRRSAQIDPLLPLGAGRVAEFPRREEERFGEEGEAGDRLFEAAMATFQAGDFGDQQGQGRSTRAKFGQVGLFGDWLQRHNFGKYVTWEPRENGKGWVTVAMESDGKPRVPSAAALNQYMLVQARSTCPGRWG